MSAFPVRKPAYRPHEMPGRLGIGKTKFYQLEKTEGFPKPSVLGPRSRTWSEDQVLELLAARCIID